MNPGAMLRDFFYSNLNRADAQADEKETDVASYLASLFRRRL